MMNSDFDMTTINLDLAAESADSTQVLNIVDASGSPDSGSAQGNDEVATKLALAKAYEEMGIIRRPRTAGRGDCRRQQRSGSAGAGHDCSLARVESGFRNGTWPRVGPCAFRGRHCIHPVPCWFA
ncbi:MAG: hypothetical protein HT580_02810 [Dechloromonas sp.]|nr:MAG: hypothetical protein HT580_02810 [Dechloromonas sp.]